MKVIGCVFLILGSFMGAGFVSGREVAEYFARFGTNCYPAIILSGILLFFLIYLFLGLSSRVNSFISFSRLYFGKFSFMISILFALSLLIITSAMFAGLKEISNVLGLNYYLVLIVTSMLSFYAVLGNSNRLKQINLVIVPIMLSIILTLCVCNFNNECIYSESLLFSCMSACGYVFINIVTLGVFILEIGRGYSKKQRLLISILTSLIITISLFVLTRAINSSGLVFSTMPILNMSSSLGAFSFVFAICIWIGIFTTLISNVFVLSGYLNTLISSKRLSIIMTILTSILFGCVGFDFIIKYVYLVIALVGVFITVMICKKEIENGRAILRVTI